MTHTRAQTTELMHEYIKNEGLRNHCAMVAKAMESYAKYMNLGDDEIDAWWTAGMLHDLDWEKFPDEHPNKAVNEILPELGYELPILEAIKAHGPERTGKQPERQIERYLYACDELCGFLNAVSLMRPTKFEGMEVKSITKRLKDKRFAANANREDISRGAELINKSIEEHIGFLIKVFSDELHN